MTATDQPADPAVRVKAGAKLGTLIVTVNGMDLSHAIVRDSFVIEWGNGPLARVTMTVVTADLEVER